MKTFLPSEYINTNYKYTLNNNYIRIYTNNNCYTNYNTTYCDCLYIYPQLDYMTSEVSSCSYSSLTSYVSSTSFTNDFYYRLDFDKILLIFLIFSIFIIYLPIKLFSRIFKRGVL